jgi:S-adenosylmethionine hydrolase
MELPRPSGLVTLLTDFGLDDPYAGVMKGMVKRQHSRADVIDLTHGVPAQNVRVGALYLRAAIGRFPPGTVHAAVVDPGVGTARRWLAAFAQDCFWIAPDNGLLEALLDSVVELRVVEPAQLGLGPASRTFHGRDIVAPLCGMLSSHRLGFRALGPRADDPLRLDGGLARHEVLHVDRFGNLLTGISGDALAGADTVTVRGRPVPLHGTYAEVEPGAVLALVNSYDLLEIAVRDGRADTMLGAGPGTPVRVHGGAG